MSIPYPEKKTVPQLPIPSHRDKLVTFNSTYLDDICAAINDWKRERVILVVSRSLDQNTDKVHKLEHALGAKFAGKKVGVGSHSPYHDVLAIAKLAHDANADCIVSIGSSSYSDATKIARLLHATFPPDRLTEEGMESLIDQTKGSTRPGVFSSPTTKLILVPCSLSVSEYNTISSATNQDGKKQHFSRLDFVPGAADLILLDPAVASTAPPETLWLPSGARAVDHAVEGICCSLTVPEGVESSINGLRAIIRGLNDYKAGLDAKAPGTDESMLKAISACQQGARDAIQGLLVYGSKVGPSHAIGHQLGSVGKVPHGLTSCVCLPATLRYEKEHPENQYFRLEGHKIVVDVFNEELGWQEKEAGDAVERFYRSLGLPTRLSDVGVTDDEAVWKIAEKTMTDIWGGGPRQIDDPKEIMKILETVR
ncbi:hypothetical protein ANI_1_1286084 [Paecilomyces variotii No. 5]|uniref:Uncharacterized protein n=1 Tax=Byssochlamys spectabilis (strain No. 5 / NBRC 109023) TaxID=1356009 RepID=V5G330_BYSSN|nr:hypothetical protein ANI_1_1286084 [Paecilomyces variotii No. 5]